MSWRGLERKALLAKAMSLADVPEWTVKTTLQRAVQALKRHRDIYFTGHLDDRPASVIVTTLAALAYQGGSSLYEVLSEVTSKMPALVGREGGVYLVPNPVQPKENFADRWRQHPERAEKFFQWMEQARADFAAIGEVKGVDAVLGGISKAFGERVATLTERAAGSGLFESRQAGQLGMVVGTGTLTAGSGRPVPPHRFHGEPSHRS